MGETKEKIMREALKLFACAGYEAVSVSDIAGVIGITKGALYRHYESKRDIFEHILRRMEADDASGAEGFGLPTSNLDESNAAEYRSVSLDSLAVFAKAQFIYWTENDFAADFRRLLTLEQYRRPEMGELFGQYLGSGPSSYVEDILGSLGFSDPAVYAAQIYAPMFLFYGIFDHTAADRRNEIKNTAFACIDRTINELKKGSTI